MKADRIRLYARVGEQLRAMRERHGRGMNEVAEALGVSRSTLQKIEQGVTPCPLHLLVAFAEAFDCTLDELVPVDVEAAE